MTKAVIVSAARTPVGRAGKGSLRDERPDDLGAFVVRSLMESVPQVAPDTIDDVVFGAKRQIVGDFVEHTELHPDYPGVPAPFYTCEYQFRLTEGESTYPLPPISGTKS